MTLNAIENAAAEKICIHTIMHTNIHVHEHTKTWSAKSFFEFRSLLTTKGTSRKQWHTVPVRVECANEWRRKLVETHANGRADDMHCLASSSSPGKKMQETEKGWQQRTQTSQPRASRWRQFDCTPRATIVTTRATWDARRIVLMSSESTGPSTKSKNRQNIFLLVLYQSAASVVSQTRIPHAMILVFKNICTPKEQHMLICVLSDTGFFANIKTKNWYARQVLFPLKVILSSKSRIFLRFDGFRCPSCTKFVVEWPISAYRLTIIQRPIVTNDINERLLMSDIQQYLSSENEQQYTNLKASRFSTTRRVLYNVIQYHICPHSIFATSPHTIMGSIHFATPKSNQANRNSSKSVYVQIIPVAGIDMSVAKYLYARSTAASSL